MIRRAILAIAVLTAACSPPAETKVEAGPAANTDPLPAMPDWVTPLIGQPVAGAYPTTVADCRGYVDAIDTRFGGTPSGTQISGWGFDMAARKPFAKILIVDEAGLVQGGAISAGDRPDVPAGMPAVTSAAVGFTALTSVTTGTVSAIGVDDARKTACGLGNITL